MPADRFVLKHHKVEVDYDTGALPGCTALTYKDGSTVKHFKASEITRTETPLGSLVSVSLTKVLDGGSCFGESFGFFLPGLDAPSWENENVGTAGIYLELADRNVHPKVLASYRCIELQGTGTEVAIVPLEEGSTP